MRAGARSRSAFAPQPARALPFSQNDPVSRGHTLEQLQPLYDLSDVVHRRIGLRRAEEDAERRTRRPVADVACHG
jgi:hypothetical protein